MSVCWESQLIFKIWDRMQAVLYFTFPGLGETSEPLSALFKCWHNDKTDSILLVKLAFDTQGK